MMIDYENSEDFDFLQKEEIRKGIIKNLDVSVYAKPEIPFNIMRQLRKGLESGYDLSKYVYLGIEILPEIRKAFEHNILLDSYIIAGYDGEQLVAIRHALEKNIYIDPYLNIYYHGSCIEEIALGLEHNIDVTPYADVKYTWRKMREIRLGIEHRVDISKYSSSLYSYWQMREIRLGLEKGLDVDYYSSLMYTAKEMKKRRLCLECQVKLHAEADSWNIICDDDYEIKISPDGLRAYFNWHCRRPIKDVSELETILNKNGIVYGIDKGALILIAQKYNSDVSVSEPDQNTLVASGTKAVDGKNSYSRFYSYETR